MQAGITLAADPVALVLLGKLSEGGLHAALQKEHQVQAGLLDILV